MIILGIFFIGIPGLFAQQVESSEQKMKRMQWFKDAKLGIFIHWGIYAVNGIDESWSFHNGYITYEDYMKQLERFTADNYDPKAWAELIPKTAMATAIANSKLLEAAVNDRVVDCS